MKSKILAKRAVFEGFQESHKEKRCYYFSNNEFEKASFIINIIFDFFKNEKKYVDLKSIFRDCLNNKKIDDIIAIGEFSYLENYECSDKLHYKKIKPSNNIYEELINCDLEAYSIIISNKAYLISKEEEVTFYRILEEALKDFKISILNKEDCLLDGNQEEVVYNLFED